MSIKNIQGKIKFKDKVNEDPELLRLNSNLLKRRRGYVVKMPRKGSSVVTCMSGGMDSVANIFVLLEEYGYNVFPFFIKRGQSAYKQERASIDYYDKLFVKKYPGLYHKTLEIEVNTPGNEYKDMLRATKKAVDDVELRHNISYPSRNSIIFLTGMEYAYSLESQGIKARTIFGAHMSSDSSYHCSLTWTRLTNVTMCQITNEYDWQFIDIPIETEFGNFFDKDVYINYCNDKKFDLTKTRTCVKDHPIQCGDCPTCWDRRRAYKEAGVKDLTKYRFDMSEKFPTYYDHQ